MVTTIIKQCFFISLFVPRVRRVRSPPRDFNFMYDIWQDAGNRTRVTATAARCATNELHTFQCYTCMLGRADLLYLNQKVACPLQILLQFCIAGCYRVVLSIRSAIHFKNFQRNINVFYVLMQHIHLPLKILCSKHPYFLKY